MKFEFTPVEYTPIDKMERDSAEAKKKLAEAKVIEAQAEEQRLKNELLKSQIEATKKEAELKNRLLAADVDAIEKQKRREEYNADIIGVVTRGRETSRILRGQLDERGAWYDEKIEKQTESNPVKKKIREAEDAMAISEIENIQQQSEEKKLKEARKVIEETYSDDYDLEKAA